MKPLYILSLFLLISAGSFAQTFYVYTANKNASWNDMSAWNTAVRTDGVRKTKAIIPAAYTISADNAVNNMGLGDIEIVISGTLAILPSTNLLFTAASTITLAGSGRITGTTATQVITIGSVVKYKGSLDNTKTGASVANATTSFSPNGFTSALLPVIFSGFTAVKNGNAVILNWSTASEVSNDYFTVERSYNGSTWMTVSTVKGTGSNTATAHYLYTDNNVNGTVVYYRLKQTDIDGAFVYSTVKTVIGSTTAAAKIYRAGKTISIELNTEIKNAITVTVMNINGQITEKKQFSAGYKITLDESNQPTGIVIVNIADNNALNQTARLLF